MITYDEFYTAVVQLFPSSIADTPDDASHVTLIGGFTKFAFYSAFPIDENICLSNSKITSVFRASASIARFLIFNFAEFCEKVKEAQWRRVVGLLELDALVSPKVTECVAKRANVRHAH